MDDKTMKIAAVAAIAIIAIAGVAVFMMNSDDGKDDAKFEIMNVEGVDATVDNVVNGSYTLQRGLILATKGTASGAVAEVHQKHRQAA